MTTREQRDQVVFDELTEAIAKHNKAVAETIVIAEDSLKTAREQLHRAEHALTELKKYIINVVENGKLT